MGELREGGFLMDYTYGSRQSFLGFVVELFSTNWFWFLLIAIGTIAITMFCLKNDKVCVIEYMDGEVERIECVTAHEDRRFFGSTTTLEIIIKGEDDMVKSLSTIKRWKLQ